MIGLVEVGRYGKVIPPVYDISAVLSKAVHQPVPSLPNVHCRRTFGAQQKINHVVRDAGKMSADVNMPFECCNSGCITHGQRGLFSVVHQMSVDNVHWGDWVKFSLVP